MGRRKRRRSRQQTRSESRDEPALDSDDWVEWGGELVFAAGFTSGLLAHVYLGAARDHGEDSAHARQAKRCFVGFLRRVGSSDHGA